MATKNNKDWRSKTLNIAAHLERILFDFLFSDAAPRPPLARWRRRLHSLLQTPSCNHGDRSFSERAVPPPKTPRKQERASEWSRRRRRATSLPRRRCSASCKPPRDIFKVVPCFVLTVAYGLWDLRVSNAALDVDDEESVWHYYTRWRIISAKSVFVVRLLLITQ